MAATVEEGEYMALADGIGVIPKKYRNKAYTKLDFGPGEGGLGDTRGTPATGMDEFLAGIAAGADPKEFATQLLSKSTGRSRRAQKGAS